MPKTWTSAAEGWPKEPQPSWRPVRLQRQATRGGRPGSSRPPPGSSRSTAVVTHRDRGDVGSHDPRQQLGAEMQFPGPASHDSMLPQARERSAGSLALVEAILTDLRSYDPATFDSPGQTGEHGYWHHDMLWYRPASAPTSPSPGSSGIIVSRS